MMTLGKGVAYSTSCKQKLNTKSSTEAELVAIDDAMGQILWTRHFLAAQGVPVPTTTIYQDNKSTILLAENGSTSSGKRTRHLNVRYYFVTDKIKKGEVKVAYCPTRDMLGDFFTKPLQGSIFVNMRAKILNLPSSEGAAAHRSVLRNDKNISTSVARNVKWARGTEVHTRQPDNKVENSAMRRGENSATQRSS
jgi:hypothetical protein